MSPTPRLTRAVGLTQATYRANEQRESQRAQSTTAGNDGDIPGGQGVLPSPVTTAGNVDDIPGGREETRAVHMAATATPDGQWVQQPMRKEKWLLDTGASLHATANPVGITNMINDTKPVTVGNGQTVKTLFKGTVELTTPSGKKIKLSDVYYVPQLARKHHKLQKADGKGLPGP